MYHILNLTHEQWLIERKNGIGSSEAGILMGLSNYEKATPMRLWRKKLGIDPTEAESPAMVRGHMFEQAVADYFVKRTGAVIDPASIGDFLAVDNDRDFLRVSPDRLFWPADMPENERNDMNSLILECKTTNRRIGKDRLGNWLYPESWYAQVQYQMGVMNRKRAAICWFVMGLDEDVQVWVDFNPAFYRNLVQTVERFWVDNILGETPPDVLMNDEDAKLRWPFAIEGKKAVANAPLLDLIARRNKVQDTFSVIEKEKKECDKLIRQAIGDVETLLDDNGNIVVTYRNGAPRNDFDKVEFQRDHPDLYEQYCHQTTSRTLRFHAKEPED